MKPRIRFRGWLLLLLLSPVTNIFAQYKTTRMDYQLIIEAVTAIFTGTDARDWTKVSNAFAPIVELDYSSLSGQPAARLSPEAIITAWKGVLPGFEHTHHQLGNFVVEQKGKTAEVSCYGTASHYLSNASKNNIWTVVGTYDFHLAQYNNTWKVDKMVMHFKYQDGNTQLPALAAEKVKAFTNNQSNTMSNDITKKKVHFTSEGLTLTGDLFLPAGFNEQQQYGVVIVEGSWITVKEQMAELYAERMAKNGFLALAFDFRYYGESEGEPRNYESPESKIVDLKNAVTYLSSLPYVDKNKIYALGICASSGYMARAAAEDTRIQKLALVAPWLHNAAIVREIYGGEKGVQEKIDAGRKARKAFAATGEVISVLAVSDTDTSAAMYGPFTYYLDKTRGAIPEWPNRFAVMSWPEWLEFDGIQVAGKLNTPTLIVHSEQAAIPHGAKQFYNALKTPRKEIHWINNNQFDFYDQEAPVNFSVEKVVNWFK